MQEEETKHLRPSLDPSSRTFARSLYVCKTLSDDNPNRVKKENTFLGHLFGYNRSSLAVDDLTCLSNNKRVKIPTFRHIQ